MFPDKQKAFFATILVSTFLIYTTYIYTSLPAEDKVPLNEVMAGKKIWQQLNCNACHQIYGLGGYIGPDLTNAYSLKGPAYIKAFLQNGTASMPSFKLTNKEKADLLYFLQNIDLSGKADPRTFTINYDGTIEQ